MAKFGLDFRPYSLLRRSGFDAEQNIGNLKKIAGNIMILYSHLPPEKPIAQL